MEVLVQMCTRYTHTRARFLLAIFRVFWENRGNQFFHESFRHCYSKLSSCCDLHLL